MMTSASTLIPGRSSIRTGNKGPSWCQAKTGVVSAHPTPILVKLRPASPILRLSPDIPLYSARRVRMAQTFTTRATLGLTKPTPSVIPHIAFSAKEIEFSEWNGELLAVAVLEKDMSKDESSKFKNAILRRLDMLLGGLLGDASAEEDFAGKTGQLTLIRLRESGFRRIGLFGLGQSTLSPAPTTYQGLGDAIAAAAKAVQASNVAVVLASSEGFSEDSKLNTASAIASGILLGVYEDERFKTESKKLLLKSVDILGLAVGAGIDSKLKYAVVLADEASKIASMYCDVLTATILDEDQCKEYKMGSYLGVAAASASANPPRFIHIHYKPPNGQVKAKLAIVGKGLTFDSGGYNLKTGPGCSIELMKFDMGGSAAALGAAKSIGQIKPPGVEVHFIVAACENMISGTGMRPGDIVTASNGKTIEVNNTDAEGRLTLADALVYACKQGAEKVVDLATLTGACVVALGPTIAGVFTPSDELEKELRTASEVTGEKFWRLPLEESYWESMKSGVADMVNTGPRQGGAISAALFLKQFVDEKVQWLHIDMAGPVWNEKKKAATGFGVSTLVEWVLKNSSA
ncbi:leucine aminopeptidase 1-like isoform X5 [Magnolia sinica]|uniref:leucine aminopeptidase 1-like isoform X5 n=1 Tax=Magnolia sinica TaxID=86752 RepID=UPI0026593F0F|nr:leucine aminopeptidase 1-like isoform X5 [Magnolia sinica]